MAPAKSFKNKKKIITSFALKRTLDEVRYLLIFFIDIYIYHTLTYTYYVNLKFDNK